MSQGTGRGGAGDGSRQGVAAPALDAEAVRQRLTFADLAVRDALVVRKVAASLVANCPFHEERSGSFVIGGRRPDRAKCFGCGWGGDIFDYWQQRHGVDFPEAVRQLGALVGLLSPIEGLAWAAPQGKVVSRVSQLPAELREKPALPPLRQLREDEIGAIAASRGLSVEGVRVAARVFRRIGACDWPLWQRRRDGRWVSTCLVHGWKCGMDSPECEPRPKWPSWVMTDETRRVAEFRRVDGERYPVKGGEGIKSWSTAGKSWPIGASELGTRRAVLWVEGGPDVLAAYHFLWGWGLLDRVAVVGMLGASARIAEEALRHFDGCRVRIMMDADELRDSSEAAKRKIPGLEAAKRWTEQLTAAGATVETFNLGPAYEAESLSAYYRGEIGPEAVEVLVPGLVRADGLPVKDLNDLALCEAETVDSSEIREAFFDWEF